MDFRPLGSTGFSIAPLMLGGNVFGWTADEATSFAVLDAFVDHGLNAIDTADSYSRWVPGHVGGESETIIGKWMRARGSRNKVMLATKVGSDMGQGHRDLSAKWIAEEVDNSLRRLGVDHIDLYQSHWPDDRVTHEETLEAYAKLIKAGKVRAIGTSNYDETLLGDALKASAAGDLPRYGTLQNEYNLISRARYEGAVQDMVVREGLGMIPYSSLASGFLSGKYRSEADFTKSARGPGMARFLNDTGFAVLGALDNVAQRTGAAHSEIALAWLMAQPGVTAPIASATSVEQVRGLRRAVDLVLSAEDLAELTAAGR